LTTVKDVKTGIFPDVDKAIAEFEALIKWQQVNAFDRVPEPVKGFDLEYDAAKQAAEVV
jgi:hypothetical protein